MATCIVSGTLVDPSETPMSGISVTFRIANSSLNGSSTNFFLPKEITTTSAVNGTWTLTLSQGLSGQISLDFPQTSISPTRRLNYSVIIPATPTTTFNSIATEL